MAKRKRLTPLGIETAHPEADISSPDSRAPETKAMHPFGVAPPPISRVAQDAAATAALREVAQELTQAREDGRLVQRLPLEAIVADHLLRDRLAADDDDMASLIDSLRAHGQRTPIEVTDLGHGRYGLISGQRRLTALLRLRAETEEARFDHVLALLRRPASASDAYIAMVEENEIRAGLSYWERARIAAKSVDAGVFASEKIALQRLFAAASRAKRSKIGSFITLVQALDGHLRFPAALPERLGLALVSRLEGQGQARADLIAALRAADPATAAAEQATLARWLAAPRPVNAPVELRPGLYWAQQGGRLVLSGPALDSRLCEQLQDWLRRLPD